MLSSEVLRINMKSTARTDKFVGISLLFLISYTDRGGLSMALTDTLVRFAKASKPSGDKHYDGG